MGNAGLIGIPRINSTMVREHSTFFGFTCAGLCAIVVGGVSHWSLIGMAATAIAGIFFFPRCFYLATLVEKRGWRALLPAAAAATGIAAFSVFCAIRFGDAAAFIHEEQVWRHGLAQGATEWGVLLGRGMTSFDHWKFQLQVIPLVAVLLLANKRPSAWFTVPLWAFVIFVEHWCWDRDFSFAVILLLGGISMIYFRRQLGVATVTYGFVAVAVLGLAGVPMSVDRILYAVLPFSFAVGLFLERFPVSAAGLLWATAYDLFVKSAAFAQNLWVA
jgi:hypothetical protein